MNTLRYYLAAICAFTLWGTFSLVLKPLHSFASSDILFYRVFSCAIIMTVVSVLFKRKMLKDNLNYFKSIPKKNKKDLIILNVGSSILLTANWFSFIYVMNHVSVRATSVAYLVCPIITTILAYFLLKDKLTRLQWLSVFLSFLGCLLLSYAKMIDMFYSSLIGFTYAAYLVSQNKNKQFDKFLVLNFHILLSALILLPFFPFYSGSLITDLKFYFYIEIIAVMYTIVPLLLNLYALSGISSSKVGMILNINPIIAFVLAGVVYHEPLGSLQIFSYALIFLAVIVFNGKEIFRLKSKKA
ncbi:EamA family transporter [Epilithonimonas ginsengisoli]|uniref:EamA family transporter n=1 Tax=Epilithonimonas ginsengisoli TaxID=1245592 RepID=A0ABU4JD44_9FLAO|nr:MULTISPECIES: EamA family transporter [Chryseobacterium group]MBV6878552.1 EamA family transporter [Epilithonimonas sp. FP105]MDW8547577.1 EamA family transporter [Epilithonimonas ginsengisoli]OAH75176.1 permease [Chryseobacterium sp. FP211-J200]